MKRRGVIIPTSLFFVMFVFLVATIMVSRASLDLNVSKYEENQISQELRARGAAAKALTLLNKDDAWKEHDQDNPFRFTEEPLVSEGWVVKDPENPNIHHVYGRSYPAGAPERAEISTRVVIRRPDNEGTVFTFSQVDGKHTPDSLFFKRRYDNDWTLLPAVPAQEYDKDGNLVYTDGKFAGFVANLSSDSNGKLYAMTMPGYDRLGVVRGVIRKRLRKGQFSRLWNEIGDRTDSLGKSLRKKVFGGSVILRYDTAVEAWESLPPAPNIDFSTGTDVLEPDKVFEGGLGAIDVTDDTLYVALHKDGQDGLLSLDLNSLSGTPVWTSIPPPPNKFYDTNGALQVQPGTMEISGNTKADLDGNIFSVWRNDDMEGNALFRKSGSAEWEAIAHPPKGHFNDSGAFVPAGGKVDSLSHLDITQDGNLIGVWNPPEGSDEQYVVYEYKKQDDGSYVWDSIPATPSFRFDDNGQAVKNETGSKLSSAKSVAADSEGRVLVSFDGQEEGDDGLCYADKEETEVLPRLPDEGWDKKGKPKNGSGESLDPLQVAGGGFQNGDSDRYVPVYRY